MNRNILFILIIVLSVDLTHPFATIGVTIGPLIPRSKYVKSKLQYFSTTEDETNSSSRPVQQINRTATTMKITQTISSVVVPKKGMYESSISTTKSPIEIVAEYNSDTTTEPNNSSMPGGKNRPTGATGNNSHTTETIDLSVLFGKSLKAAAKYNSHTNESNHLSVPTGKTLLKASAKYNSEITEQNNSSGPTWKAHREATIEHNSDNIIVANNLSATKTLRKAATEYSVDTVVFVARSNTNITTSTSTTGPRFYASTVSNQPVSDHDVSIYWNVPTTQKASMTITSSTSSRNMKSSTARPSLSTGNRNGTKDDVTLKEIINAPENKCEGDEKRDEIGTCRVVFS